MVVIFRTHNYTIRHDLPLPLFQSFCIDIAYVFRLANFLVVALLVIWFNLIIVQIEII
jgi:hypothetical protein